MPNSGGSADAVIIGAGFSGLAAGLRLACFGKRVVVLEAHTVPGGLNSYYFRGPGKPRLFNSGLHTFTNYRRTHAKWGRHFLFRSLGIAEEEVTLHPPRLPALIATPSHRVELNQGFHEMKELLSQRFGIPAATWAEFEKEVTRASMQPRDDSVTDLAVLQRLFRPRELIDLLRLPVFLYAGYSEHVLPWALFAGIFRSLWIDGYCSPADMKTVLDCLLRHLRAGGAQVRFRARAKRIVVDVGKVRGVELENGEQIATGVVISSAGEAETQALVSLPGAPPPDAPVISACETLIEFDDDTAALGATHSLVFAAFREPFEWTREVIRSGVPYATISASDAYTGNVATYPHHIKVGTYCLGQEWLTMRPEEYTSAKTALERRLLEVLQRVFPKVDPKRARCVESLTPVTIARYTSHFGGGLYGAQKKNFSGRGSAEGLYICGNDQGGIGIVGAAISGLVMANFSMLEAQHEARRATP